MTETVRRSELRHPRGIARLLIGDGALEAAQQDLADWLAGRTLFIVSSPQVRKLHGERLAPIRALAARVVELEVVDGEAAKNLETAGQLWREMLAAGGKRDSRLLTFGGGSVGDLGGFVAGCFLRGIEYVQVPTTLLAQVDAAIGGKTAVDLPDGKNTVGLFHHPAFVISDTQVLGTLPVGEIRSGLVEAIKKAALLDPELLELIEQDPVALLSGNPAALGPVVAGAALAKCRVVEADPEEGDYRRILNFGHTLGHAIEGVLEYQGLRHGEAIAYGILFAIRLAARRGLEDGFAERLHALLGQLDLPDLGLGPEDVPNLLGFMARDKKATEQGITWVLPRGIGKERMERLPPDWITEELPKFLEAPFELP